MLPGTFDVSPTKKTFVLCALCTTIILIYEETARILRELREQNVSLKIVL